jgi:hypothetical protein
MALRKTVPMRAPRRAAANQNKTFSLSRNRKNISRGEITWLVSRGATLINIYCPHIEVLGVNNSDIITELHRAGYKGRLNIDTGDLNRDGWLSEKARRIGIEVA